MACNFTPVGRTGYALGVPSGGAWRELLNSDAATYGGANWGNLGQPIQAEPVPRHGQPHSLTLTLPPLSVVVLKADGVDAAGANLT